jgi:hypothetical protein
MLNLEVGNSYQSRYVLKCTKFGWLYLTKYQISNFKQYNPCSNMLDIQQIWIVQIDIT